MTMRLARWILGLGSLLTITVSTTASAQYNPATPPTWPGTPISSAFRYDAPELTPIGVTIPDITVAGSSLPRDGRLDELSAALQYDADRIYEYVRNQIQTTPTFGLTKGAFGAMLDQAGNPFDQAHLMVTLMDAADAAASKGYNADYIYGSITLDQTAFAQNFGPNSARGACELLAAGGVPATVNGASSACSTYSASAGSFTVVMRHVWVRATIGGSAYLFDPSLKAQARTLPKAAVIAAVPAGASLQPGATAGPTPEQPTVEQYAGYDPAALRSTLNAATTTVRTALTAEESVSVATTVPGVSTLATNAALSMSEAIGGAGDISRQTIYGSGQAQRLTSLPGHSQTHSWTEIPTHLRTYVHLMLRGDAALATLTVSEPAANLAGRRIMFASENASGIDTFLDVTGRILIDEKLAKMPGGADAEGIVGAGYGLTGSPYTVRAAIYHPFYGGSSTAGGIAQSLYGFEVTNAFPTYLILGLGERGDGAELRNTAAVSLPGIVGWAINQPCYYPPGQPDCVVQDPAVTQRAAQTSSAVAAGEGFLTQSSRLLDIYAGLAGGRRAAHHIVGVAALSISVDTQEDPTPPIAGPYYKNELVGQQMTLDIAGRMGFAPFTSASKSRQTFALATGGALASLEQTLLRKVSDSPSVNGTASMFDWFATATRTQAYNQSSATDPRNQIRFLRIPDSSLPTDRAAAASLMWFYPGTPPANPYSAYADFTIVSPQSGRVGPVRRGFRTDRFGTAEYNTSFPCASTASCTIADFDQPENAYATRYSGFFAYQLGASSIAVAPIAQSRLKGGSGGNFPEGIQAPTTTRADIDKAYETWATRFDVDGRTGGLTMTPPSDLTTGAGDYPYSLAFQRTYSTNRDSIGPLGKNWTHNHDVRLSSSTDIGQALGEDSPRHALATIVAAQATLDLLQNSTNLNRDLVTATLVQNWWSDAVFDNQATIGRGSASERFILQPDGVWQPEVGSTAVLSRTGTRLAQANQNLIYPATADDTHVRNVQEAYDRSGWSFTYTGADGAREVFNSGFDLTVGDFSPDYASQWRWANGRLTNPIGSGSTFLRASTVMPYGVTVNYTYTTVSDAFGTLGKRLDRVHTDAPFGRSLYLEYDQVSFNSPNVADEVTGYPPIQNETIARYRLKGVRTEESARRVDFTYTAPGNLTSVADVMGSTTTYRYSQKAYAPQPDLYVADIGGIVERMDGLRLPTDPANDFLSFAYDSSIRTVSATNRRGAIWRYFASEQARGRTQDPEGWNHFTYYDREGRTFAETISDAFIREYAHDGVGRRIRHAEGPTASLLQRELIQTFAHDVYGNQILSRRLTRTDAAGVHQAGASIDALTEYGYSGAVSGVTTFRGLKTRDIDPEGRATLYCYASTQSGCSGVQVAGADGLLRGTYGPAGEEARVNYTTLGRVDATFTKVSATETRQTTRAYGANGLPSGATLVNPSGPGLSTGFVWDSTGNLSTVTDAAGRRARGAYRADRRLSQLTSSDQDAASAMVSRFRYDAAHRLQYADQAATVTGTAGALVGSNWATTELVYTHWGKLDRIIDPAGDANRFVYLQNDLLEQDIDGENRSTAYSYATDGATTCIRKGFGTPQVTTDRRMETDHSGTAVRWWNGNHVTGCTPSGPAYVSRTRFDNWYRPVGHEFPDATTLAEIRSPAGNVSSQTTRAGQTHALTYDASNRLIQDQFEGNTITSAYNLAGERTSIIIAPTAPSGVAYAYDFAGRLTQEQRIQDSRATQYEYDGSGNRTAIRWPDGWTARYAYDGAGRLTLVCEDAANTGVCGQTLAAYAYDRRGRRTDARFHGGIGAGTSGMASTWSLDNSLTRRVHSFSAATGVTFDNTYDHSGKVSSVAANASGWLCDPCAPGFTRTWATDFSLGASGDLDRLRSYTDTGGLTGTTSLSYNLNGALTGDGPSTYVQDGRNWLKSVTSTRRGGGWSPPVSTSATWAMTYDPTGRRIGLTATGTGVGESLLFLHAGDMEIADLAPATGNILRRYVPGAAIDERVAMIVTNAGAGAGGTANATHHREYYHTDRLGHVIAMAHQDGTQTARYIYTPYGVEEPWNVSGQPFRYTGQRRDGDTGLYYYRARYYDPALGRFIQPDPILFDDQMNLYAYVGNDPVNGTDPTGRQTVPGTSGMTLEDWQAAGADFMNGARDFAQGALQGGADATDPMAFNFPDTNSGRAGYATGSAVVGLTVSIFEGLTGAAIERRVAQAAFSRLAASADRNGLTRAGRALQKHAGREGSAFSSTSSRASDLNRNGQSIIEDIMKTGERSSYRHRNYGNVTEYRSRDGRGVRFDERGRVTLLEPTRRRN